MLYEPPRKPHKEKADYSKRVADSCILNLMTETMSDAFALFNNIVNTEYPDDQTTDGDDDLCLISGQKLDGSRVTLPCNHSFNYVPLLEDIVSFMKDHGKSALKCPYCRRFVRGTIPYRPDVMKSNRPGVNTPVWSCFAKHDCAVENCAINATIPVGGQYACHTHYKRVVKANASKAVATYIDGGCTAVLKSGKRKGETCGAKTMTGLCKRHLSSQQG